MFPNEDSGRHSSTDADSQVIDEDTFGGKFERRYLVSYMHFDMSSEHLLSNLFN